MGTGVTEETQASLAPVDYRTEPSRYKHWRLSFDGPVATLTMDVERRWRHPSRLQAEVQLLRSRRRYRAARCPAAHSLRASGNSLRGQSPARKNRIFCSGANIYMLGLSSHAWKVNFCKFTNETRNGIEDSSAHSGLKFIAALNGTTRRRRL